MDNWVSNASCAELNDYYQQMMSQVDYWSNVETSGTGVASKIPNTNASMALNTADKIAVESYTRCS